MQDANTMMMMMMMMMIDDDDDDEDEIQELPLILVAWPRPVLLRHWTGWWAVELVDGKMAWR